MIGAGVWVPVSYTMPPPLMPAAWIRFMVCRGGARWCVDDGAVLAVIATLHVVELVRGTCRVAETTIGGGGGQGDWQHPVGVECCSGKLC